MKTEIVAALRGGIAVGVTGFVGGVVVALISRWLRHAGDTECEFPVFKILALVETNPDERGRKLLDLVGSIDDVTHAG